jgi:protein-S-isoprenylcysteine O-methyltransferase Ste14
MRADRRGLAWPLVGTAAFALVAPATIVGWAPYAISGWRMGPPPGGFFAARIAGAVLAVCGVAALTECFLRFAIVGRGTPAPVAPPGTLVVTGLYRHTRNPMYVALVTTLVGQALLLGSLAIAEYTAAVWVTTHLFVLVYEEPALKRKFGAAYEQYRRHVPRWWPRLTPWVPPASESGYHPDEFPYEARDLRGRRPCRRDCRRARPGAG